MDGLSRHGEDPESPEGTTTNMHHPCMHVCNKTKNVIIKIQQKVIENFSGYMQINVYLIIKNEDLL